MKKNCLNCGTEIEVKPSRYERTKYCSKDCTNEGRKGQRRSPDTEFKKGNVPHNYKGGVTYSKGYRLLKQPDHPRASMNGYVSEHILVWEKANGRMLPNGWCVHHYNGIKDDNRPENLIGMPRKNHHPALDPKLIKDKLRQVEGERDYWKEKYENLLSVLFQQIRNTETFA